MKTWFELLREKLDLSWLGASKEAVPFSLMSGSSGAWQADRLEMVSESHWRLKAHSSAGLEAEWEMAFFGDTRAAECWGRISHRGNEPVRRVRECRTLDLLLLLPEAFGQPWVRTVNGVRFAPNFFPPHDFAICDRQLLHLSQVHTPLNLMNSEDGLSSAENLPCAILCNESQTHGLAVFLEWSGLWLIAVQQEPREPTAASSVSSLHMQVGLRGLDLELRPGQSLPLPRLLLTAFEGDLEAGGNSLRRHIRRHVTPKVGGEEVLPPTSFNHWFAFENDFSAERVRPAVEACAAAGLEYFCVDAAWFMGGFRSGIGNWDRIDPEKFPEGVAPFARFVQARGMRYGTWFEPEWAHKASDLYRQHPEWFWTSPDDAISGQTARWRSTWQGCDDVFFDPDCHLINLGLLEAREWWLQRIVRAYEEWGMRWVRWDFNQMPRPNWDHGVPAGEVGWRQLEHVHGFYRLLDEILAACPDLLIEQTAGGGHRIDLGTARRGHTFWMNDSTVHSDIVRALQQGLNAVLPGNYPNTNLCQGRHDFTDYDFLSHGAGGFGYSGRLWEASREEFARFAEAIGRFKRYRPVLLGDYHRPTGQPGRADEYAKVVFSEAGESLVMEFNPPGRPREAVLRGRS